MIPSNGVLVGEYWEPLLVLPSEQQRVAGLEPPSEQQSEEQPEYLGESLLHLHHHRAPITATRPTGTATLPMDIPPIATLLTDIRVTGSRAMVTPEIRDTPLIPVPQAMDTRTAQDIPPTPVLRVMDTQATQGILLIPVRQATDTQATRDTPLILDPQAMDTPSNSGHPADPGNPAPGYQGSPPYAPYPGPGYGYPIHGYPGDRASEDWSPGVDYSIESSG
jgi:hypothetical protein